MGASARVELPLRAVAEVVFMAWFRVDADLVDHPKIFRLAELLNEPSAGWYYVRLLAWTSRYAARGRPRDGARTAIEHACGWRGEPGALLKAFVQVGLVDELDRQADGATLEIHDWWEIQRQYVVKAEKDAERKRNERSRRAAVTRNGAVTSRGRSADGHADNPPDVTRDGARTIRDETKRYETGKEDPRVADATPRVTVEEARALVQEGLYGKPTGELFESPQPTKPAPKKPAKPEKPTDPRHAPTVKACVEAFERLRGAPYPFAPRDASAVTSLLASLGSTEAVEAAWTRALTHKGWPTVATLPQLVQNLAHFVGSPEAKILGVGPSRIVADEHGGIF